MAGGRKQAMYMNKAEGGAAHAAWLVPPRLNGGTADSLPALAPASLRAARLEPQATRIAKKGRLARGRGADVGCLNSGLLPCPPWAR